MHINDFREKTDTFIPVDPFTTDSLAAALTANFGIKHSDFQRCVLLVNSEATKTLQEFPLFDPITEKAVLKNGFIGYMLSLAVFSDEILPPEDHFLKGVYIAQKPK